MSILWIVFTGVACTLGGMSQDHQTSAPNLALTIVAGAYDVNKVDKADGEITYKIDTAYPADSALHELKTRLAQTGWTPLAEDLWNPGVPSSHTRGWTDFIDGTSKPEVRVYQWLGHWRNAKGDVITVGIQFRANDAKPGSPPKEVATVHVALSRAESLRALGIKVPGSE